MSARAHGAASGKGARRGQRGRWERERASMGYGELSMSDRHRPSSEQIR
jgi:hypothetical protein